ncbi:MAG: hypothetical protein V2B18_25135, partial [Pseudomonadota bacterium]
MTEIRSTIELMMERTRGMTLSAEERERYRQEECRKKAKGYKLRLLDNPGSSTEEWTTPAEVPEQDRELIRRLLWEEFLNAVPDDRQGVLQYIAAMERLPRTDAQTSILAKMRKAAQAGVKNPAEGRKKL